MIIVLPFGTNFPKTDKQNIIQPQVYRQFETLISHKYEDVEGRRLWSLMASTRVSDS
jgi:hypothetical protein